MAREVRVTVVGIFRVTGTQIAEQWLIQNDPAPLNLLSPPSAGGQT
jgi:hypothetical protein